VSGSAAFAAILSQLSKLVKGLDEDQLQKIADGETTILFVPRGSKAVKPLILSDVADEVRHAATESTVIKILDADSRLTPAVLKKLAAELNITLPTTVKNKPAIQLHIAQSIIAHDRRTHGGV
jgi:hypothetical protein